MPTLNLYGAGGAGVNIVSKFIRYTGKVEPGFASFNTYFLDTSGSNLSHLQIDPSIVYSFPNLDGSGKKRDSNYQTLAEKTKDMLHRFKPSDINVVVHSASGGRVSFC